MNHRLWCLVLVALVLVGSAQGWAQVTAAQLSSLESECQYTKKVQRTLSSNGKIRAEYITFCKARSGESYLWFEAAAVHNQFFPGSNNAPWMHVELLDSRGRTLWKRDNAWLVEIPGCGPGGYEFHFHRVPATLSARVYDVRVIMGGAGGIDCRRRKDPWKDVIGKALRLVDCNLGPYPVVQQICSFLK